MILRNGMGDRNIYREVIQKGCYERHFKIERGDKFLDIGMNIGMFAIYCMDRGANIVGFEPEKENYRVANENVLNRYMGDKKRYKGWSGLLNHRAVVGNDDKSRELLLRRKHNSGAWSFFEKKGIRETQLVDCININDVLTDEITGIKIDAEGSEWEIIEAIKDFKNVKKIAIEYHTGLIGKKHCADIVKILEKEGFKVYYNKELTGLANYIYAIR